MQSKKLHISEMPIREFLVNPKGVGPAVKPSIYGKPVGLWYATGLEWVDRMQKVMSWHVTGNSNNFPYTRHFYNVINQQSQVEWAEKNEPNVRGASVGSSHIHFVYDLTYDPSIVTEDPHSASTSKILRLTSKCLDTLYTDFFIPYRNKYLGTGSQMGVYVDLESILSTAKYQYYKWKQKPQYVELYGKLLKYLYETNQFTKLIRDRYVKGDKEIDLTSEKYVTILKDDILSKKLPLEGPLHNMFLRVWGTFWREEIAPKWAGVDFPHEIFTPEYQSQHPEFGFIEYVEIPSGCLYTPPKKEPNLLFVLTWSLPENVKKQLKHIQEMLLTVYSPEETTQILLTKTYIATPTKKGEIRFHKVSLE
jgi:hypothetical protein